MSTPTARPGESIEAYKDRIQREQPSSISAHQKLLEAARATIAFVEGDPDAVEPLGLLREAIRAVEHQQDGITLLTHEEIRLASLQARMQEHYMGFHSGFTRFAEALQNTLLRKNGFNPPAKGD